MTKFYKLYKNQGGENMPNIKIGVETDKKSFEQAKDALEELNDVMPRIVVRDNKTVNINYNINVKNISEEIDCEEMIDDEE